MIALLQLSVVLIGGFLFISLIGLGIKILTADKHVYDANKRASRSFMHALTGRVPTVQEGGRDYSIHAGMAVDNKSGDLIALGGLSNESISNVLR